METRRSIPIVSSGPSTSRPEVKRHLQQLAVWLLLLLMLALWVTLDVNLRQPNWELVSISAGVGAFLAIRGLPALRRRIAEQPLAPDNPCRLLAGPAMLLGTIAVLILAAWGLLDLGKRLPPVWSPVIAICVIVLVVAAYGAYAVMFTKHELQAWKTMWRDRQHRGRGLQAVAACMVVGILAWRYGESIVYGCILMPMGVGFAMVRLWECLRQLRLVERSH